jgi:uncharacterized protein
VEGSEYRWQTLGVVSGYLIVLVAHTIEESETDAEVIRIISARRASSSERKRYEEAKR